MGTIEAGLLHSVVDAALEGMPPAAQSARRSTVEIGSAHVVVLVDGNAAVRIARDSAASAEMRKRQELVDRIPGSFGLLVPRSLGPVVDNDGLSAVATQLMPGGPCPAGEGDPRELRDLLDRVSSIPPEPLSDLLAEPLAFCGGPDWFRIQCEDVIPLLGRDVQDHAYAAASALSELKSVREVIAHGDLGGHNVFWEGGRIVGVLDWDLTSLSDRSTDLACVGVWNGWDKLPLIAEMPDVLRAFTRRNTFRLQQAAFAILNGRPDSEVEQAIGRANTWFRDHLSRG